jgi:putative ABC transport system permease protein
VTFPIKEEVWVPARIKPGQDREQTYLEVIMRVNSASDLPAITSLLQSWETAALAADKPRFGGSHVASQTYSERAVGGNARAILYMMLAAVLLLLVIACANAANLMLVRLVRKQQEFALRAALGAGRWRMLVQSLSQSLVLATIAVALALPLGAFAARKAIENFQTAEDAPPLWIRLDMDSNLAIFAIALVLLTALLCGLLPAWRASKQMAARIREGGRGTAGGGFAKVTRALVIAEVALCCALLLASGTLVRGIQRLISTDLGVDTSHLLTARIALFEKDFPTPQLQNQLYERVVERMRAEPGVIDAAVGTSLPGLMSNDDRMLESGDSTAPEKAPRVRYASTDTRFLSAYKARLLQGRFFDGRDQEKASQVMVVDRTFVDRYGQKASVLGRQFVMSPGDPEARTMTVIGIVDRLILDDASDDLMPAVLMPLSQAPAGFVSLVVRTKLAPADFIPRLTALMREVNADTPLYWVRDYERVITEATFAERWLAKLFSSFGLIGLLLASAGLYGMVAFDVSQRGREVAVRRALGARAMHVLTSVYTRVSWQLGIGLSLGLLLGIPFANMLARQLDSMAGTDLLSLFAVLTGLILTAIIAAAIPARRLLKVDPMAALSSQ